MPHGIQRDGVVELPSAAPTWSRFHLARSAPPVSTMIRRLAMMLAAAAVAVMAFVPTNVEVAAGQGSDDAAGDVAAGERVFRTNCAMCHGADASGMMGMHPSLRGAIDRLSRDGVEVSIRNGRRTQPPMPAFEDRLTDDEIDDVVAYIAALPDGPRNFGPGDGGGMMDGDGMMMNGGMDAGAIAIVALGVLAVAGLVAAAVLLARSRSPRRQLDRRYAAGELSRDEYLQARRDLQGDGRG